MSVVSVRNLVIRYGDFTAVDDISFEVSRGKVLGILGSNGAGKSSTLRVLAGVIPPFSGNVLINGIDVTAPDKVDKAREIIGYCPDVGGLIKTATIREHIGITLSLHRKLHLWNQALELVDRFDLMDFLDKPTGGFSHGMSRRLSVILAALSAQDVLILDEPFDGVDPNGVNTTIDIINEATSSGLGVILSTHLQTLLTRASDTIAIMSGGKILEGGDAQLFAGAEGETLYEQLIQKVSKSGDANVRTESATQ